MSEPVPGCWCGSNGWRPATQDVGPVAEGVSEMRIDYGPGYRVYFKRQGLTVVVLLADGDKRTQNDDIDTA